MLSRNKENNNPVKCVHSGEPTLGKLCRDYGNDFTEKYLCVWLIQIQELIGVKNKMNDFQIEMCAQMLLDEFKQINLADLQLVCKRAVSGVYGQFYESIQIPKVIEWFRLYFEERCEMSAMSNQQIKTSGKIESQASDTVKALMGLGVLNAEDFKKMEVKDEEEFRKFNVEYHREKIIKKSE